MANVSKNVVLLVLLALAAAGVFLAGVTAKPKDDAKSVELSQIFEQKAPPVQVIPKEGTEAKDPVPSPSIVANGDAKEEGYAIQVYSFQSKARAEAALINLQSSGYKAFIVMSDLGAKGTWYRVRVGGYASEGDAVTHLDELRKVYKSGFIIKPQA